MSRRIALLGMGCGLGLMVSASIINRSDFIWNRTESMPKGLYFVDRSARISTGDLVAFAPSDEVRHWLNDEGIVGSDWPLLKHVAGLSGDEICRCDTQVSINGITSVDALKVTESGSALPVWQGCQTLKAGDVFLLNSHPLSVDGRYFGVQDGARIIGVARSIWTYGNRSAEDQATVKAIDSGTGMASVSRRARLRECHPATHNPLSAHPFLCDPAPEAGCTDLQSAARLEP